MIINAREQKNENHLRGSITASARNIITNCRPGEIVIIEKMIDKRGKTVSNNSIRMMVARLCRQNNIEYSTFTGSNGEFCFTRYD